MSLFQEIKGYIPVNQQEEYDKKLMLQYMMHSPDYLDRKNQIAHFTTSIWTVNQERTKTLMVYHNIYDSWSWIGGHADGSEDLRAVAQQELWEETGIKNSAFVCPDIFSLEILTVNGHIKKGVYIPSHLHFNVTYLAEADEKDGLIVNEAENQAVKWWTFEDALRMPKEPWLVEHIYKKLNSKVIRIKNKELS